MQIYNKNNLNRHGFAGKSLLLTNTNNMRKYTASSNNRTRPY